MTLKDFKINLERFEHLIKSIESSKSKLGKGAKKIFDFNEKKLEYSISSAKSAFDELKASLWGLSYLVAEDKSNEDVYLELIKDFKELEKNYNQNNLKKTLEIIEEINKKKKIEDVKDDLGIDLKYIPLDIRQDVNADLKELKKCYNAGCYRSTVILCGRLLESALHRKYYEITKQDILEKNPGIGLGTLIAKLNEKNVKFEPGVTQQIHLINQIRIQSVHKKKEAFYPNKSQAYGIMLFTVDVLEKLFR